jgi:hypothetical protein
LGLFSNQGRKSIDVGQFQRVSSGKLIADAGEGTVPLDRD